MVYHRSAKSIKPANSKKLAQDRLRYVGQQKQVAKTTDTKYADANKEPLLSEDLPPQVKEGAGRDDSPPPPPPPPLPPPHSNKLPPGQDEHPGLS